VRVSTGVWRIAGVQVSLRSNTRWRSVVDRYRWSHPAPIFRFQGTSERSYESQSRTSLLDSHLRCIRSYESRSRSADHSRDGFFTKVIGCRRELTFGEISLTRSQIVSTPPMLRFSRHATSQHCGDCRTMILHIKPIPEHFRVSQWLNLGICESKVRVRGYCL
jgi:hypothetical protein